MMHLHKVFLFFLFCTSVWGSNNYFSLINFSDSISVNDSIKIADALAVNDSLFLSDSISVNDSLSIQDSIQIADTLKPLFYKAFTHNDVYSITKNKIDRKDLRYSGDIFNHLPSGFLRDLGTLGQPSEITLYGIGFNNLSFITNGVNRNNRITNSFDAYSFQTDNIDSIIVYPITQGFIYNNYNNPAALEVIEKDSIYSIPYSRIKFYQAPDGEGMFDGRVSLYLTRRINLTLGTSNQSIDSRYNNSDFGSWLAFGKLRYMLNNNFNFILDYSYRKSNTYLFGGVNINAIAPNELENILYAPLQAPVNYPISGFSSPSPRYQKLTNHSFSGKILSNIIPFINSDLTFYYSNNLTEFRQNQFTQNPDFPQIINDNEYQTFGINFNNSFNSSLIDASLLYNFERNEINAYLFRENFSFNTVSFAGTASLKLFEDFFTPTGYLKNLNFNGTNYFGAGLDFATNKFLNLKLKTGFSYFEKPYNMIELGISRLTRNVKNKNNAFQIGLEFDSEILKTELNYFYLKQENASLPAVYQYSDTLLLNEVSDLALINKELSGFSLTGELNYWIINFEYNSTYYFQGNSVEKLNPDYFVFAGLYYKDILFNRNLNLKTGLNFYLFGPRYFYDYDFEKSIPFQTIIPIGTNTFTISNQAKTKANLKVDFFLSARIQESAVFFFIFENLLDEKYFIVPYYPAPARGLRFGVSWEFLD